MLIRSQTKKCIYNFDEIKCLSINNGDVYVDASFIGRYSNDKKAIKVLDMIEKDYLTYITVKSNQFQPAIYNIPKVFQMPQDEEV